MTRSWFLLASCMLSGACAISERATLTEIDIVTSPDGIVALPNDAPEIFRRHFIKYTHVLAPNGLPIRLLAQDGWTDDQVKHAREVLEFLLTDFPGSEYGNDKSDIANALAERKATMVLFNTEEALEEAFRSGLGRRTDLSMQDLRANESPAVGDEDYRAHRTRDAAYEEIWHLVHDYGIKPTRPRMITEMRQANDAAAARGWKAWPDDEPEEHPNEYMGVLIDNYYDLWAVHPTLYEARPIESGDIPDGKSHFGRYFANSREALRQQDPQGYALIEKFLPPHLTYTPELPTAFSGVFSLALDPEAAYTRKTQHLRQVALTGDGEAGLIGNAFANQLTGNSGDNVLTGGGADDRLVGGAGDDTAVFRGLAAEYTVTAEQGALRVVDRVAERDGSDLLFSVEYLRFSDQTVAAALQF